MYHQQYQGDPGHCNFEMDNYNYYPVEGYMNMNMNMNDGYNSYNDMYSVQNEFGKFQWFRV